MIDTERDLRVVWGHARPEERAAIAAALAIQAARRQDTTPSAWRASVRALRTPMVSGPDAWRRWGEST